MNIPFFPNNRQPTRRPSSYNQSNFLPRVSGNSMNFTDNFSDFQPSYMHNSTMRPPLKANASYYNIINNSNTNKGNSTTSDLNSSLSHTISSEKSFSSLFEASSSSSSASTNLLKKSLDNSSENSSHGSLHNITTSEGCASDDDGVFLQISNLDQWYDEASLKTYLMNQLKPIAPILSLTIETPSIAKVKVPSVQFAKQIVSHLHRKKMGHKRIFVSFLKDKTSAECSALRNKVIGLLRDVPAHQLPMSKFRELFQSRFKSSISIMDLYRMPDICTISVNGNEEKIITLEACATKSVEVDTVLKTEQHTAPYCIFHYKPDKNKGWAEIEIDPLPNVFMTIPQVQAMIQPLLQIHHGDIPVASLLYCLEAELNITLQSNERGISLEHLVSCIPNICIRNNDYGVKILTWRDEYLNTSDELASTSSSKHHVKPSINSSCGELADNISKEVIELIRMCPKSTMQFSKFIPTYHNHYGRQCRVADYGCTKLIEMFEALSNIVQVLGDGESRQITLTHRAQIRRFTTDLFKILRNQPNKSIYLSNLAQQYMLTHNRIFDVTDYGVCDVHDLLDSLRNNNFILVMKINEQTDDYLLSLQKRRQTFSEIEKTSIFAGEVVELLRNAPQFAIPFRKFVRSYHYYFGYQCKLSDYGFMRLAELLEALAGIVEMDQTNEENRKIFLSRKVALRIFAEQIHDLVKTVSNGKTIMIKVDELMEMHKNKHGYQMQGSSLGYESVIDALKFVPFMELNSHENELWLISHLCNEKFRQRAMLACLAIVDIGVKVPLVKFHAMFSEKFKFNIAEKTLHAMKHAVEIEMVNGTKMISITPMMKFIMHVVNVLEQRKVMNVQEIKSMLKLNLSTCFNFGYPNLSSIFQAYPDIFNGTKVGMNFHERSDIELVPDCAFSSAGLQKLLNANQIQLVDEKPEIYRQTPHVTSALGPIGYNPNRSAAKKPTNMAGNKWTNGDCLHNLLQQPQQQQKPQQQAYSNTNSFSRAFNNQYNGDTSSFYSKSSSDMYNSNIGSNAYPSYQSYGNHFDEPQGFYESNLKFQQQQQMQAMKRDFWSNSLNSSGCSSYNSACEASFQQQQQQQQPLQQQQYGIMAAPFARYEAPKPDTPPSKPVVWFDPIWKNDAGSFDGNRYNSGSLNSDSLKSLNVHVVSPFLSFNMKTMFTFDNLNPNGSANTNSVNNNSINNNFKM